MIDPSRPEVPIELKGSALAGCRHASGRRASASTVTLGRAQDEPPNAAKDANPVHKDLLQETDCLRRPPMSPSKNNRELAGTRTVFSREASAAEVLESLLENARESIEAALHQLSNPRLLRALEYAALRGVQVRLLLDRTKYEEGATAVPIHSNGHVTVRLLNGRLGAASRMHHKFAVVDRRTLVTGSYNWTIGSDEQNYENLVILYGRREVAAYRREFRELWQQGTEAPPRLGINREARLKGGESAAASTRNKTRSVGGNTNHSLYLMRHGASLTKGKSISLGCAEGPLTVEGKKKVSEVTRGLLYIGMDVDWIVASPARQAKETAQLVAARLQREVTVDYCESLLPGGCH